jgi:hypothetical protein
LTRNRVTEVTIGISTLLKILVGCIISHDYIS